MIDHKLMMPVRDEFGKELIEIGKDYKNVVVGTAYMSAMKTSIDELFS